MMRAKEAWGGDIDRIVHHYQGPLFGFSSRNFYAEFLAVRSLIAEADKHFPDGVRFEAPLDHDRVRLKYPLSARRFATLCGVEAEDLADMNPAWSRKAVSGRVALPVGTEVWIPRGRLDRNQALLAYADPARAGTGGVLAAVWVHPDMTGRTATADRDDGLRPAGGRDAAQANGGLVRVAVRYPAPKRAAVAKSKGAGVKASTTRRKKATSRGLRKRESAHRVAARKGIPADDQVALNDAPRKPALRKAEPRRPAAVRVKMRNPFSH
jgi:membrane-bound lytic murein transglycosylase D